MGMIDSFEAMLAQGQDSVMLRFGLGTEYLKQNDYAQAITHLRAAVEQDPDYSAAWKLLGKALAAKGEQREAIQAYEYGIEVAEKRGDKQAAKEMRIFLKRLLK